MAAHCYFNTASIFCFTLQESVCLNNKLHPCECGFLRHDSACRTPYYKHAPHHPGSQRGMCGADPEPVPPLRRPAQRRDLPGSAAPEAGNKLLMMGKKPIWDGPLGFPRGYSRAQEHPWPKSPKGRQKKWILVTSTDYFQLGTALGGTGWDIVLTPAGTDPTASPE